MTYEALRRAVFQANVDIVRAGLVEQTWGNASAVDRQSGVVAIKASGLAYDAMRPEDVVVVALDTAETVEGALRPSSDTPTHLHLYRSFSGLGGIVHTHSVHAVAWAQAGRDLPCFGTTHADYFNGAVPVTVPLRPDAIRTDYEWNTGVLIEKTFRKRNIDPSEIPAVLVAGHGPFVWGASVEQAVENAVVLETVARMALMTVRINPSARPISRELLEKHFRRKHGPDAYYGQEK